MRASSPFRRRHTERTISTTSSCPAGSTSVRSGDQPWSGAVLWIKEAHLNEDELDHDDVVDVYIRWQMVDDGCDL